MSGFSHTRKEVKSVTKDEYRDFLKNGIKKLSELIEEGGFGNPTATAIILCEHNRLIKKSYPILKLNQIALIFSERLFVTVADDREMLPNVAMITG